MLKILKRRISLISPTRLTVLFRQTGLITAEGGLAATPTGRRLEQEIFGKPKEKLIDYLIAK